MMPEYIERDDALNAIERSYWTEGAYERVERLPAADVVAVDRVALMLKESFGDPCACNFNNNDEWLPFVCEFQDECPYPPGVLDCWKQFVKHFGERRGEDEAT
jgi:hypothetical protein